MRNVAPPTWFEGALAQPSASQFVDSGGTRIRYAASNDTRTRKPGLLFVHGSLGHNHWWDLVAPFFTAHFRVFPFEFSGMGESGHGASRAHDCFVGDMAAVLGAIHVTGSKASTVVCHSFWRRAAAAGMHLDPEDDRSRRRARFVRDVSRQRGAQVPPTRCTFALPPRGDGGRAHPATAAAGLRALSSRTCRAAIDIPYRRRLGLALQPRAACAAPAGDKPPPAAPQCPSTTCMRNPALSSVLNAHSVSSLRCPIAMPHAGHNMMLDQPLTLVSVLNALLS